MPNFSERPRQWQVATLLRNTITTVGLGTRYPNDGQKVCRSMCGVPLPGSLSVWSKIANRNVQRIVCDTETSEDQGVVSYAMHSPRPQWPSCQCADGQMQHALMRSVCSVHR